MEILAGKWVSARLHLSVTAQDNSSIFPIVVSVNIARIPESLANVYPWDPGKPYTSWVLPAFPPLLGFLGFHVASAIELCARNLKPGCRLSFVRRVDRKRGRAGRGSQSGLLLGVYSV